MTAATTDIPTRLGRFEIRGKLGSGAMAHVYDGWDPVIGRRVAIKTIRPEQLDSAEAEELLARFRREAQAAGRLAHPNIVAIHEYGEDGGVAYIAMEFITGRELKWYFDRQERFAIPDVVRMMSELLGALDAAHRNGVVHRDIKPGNIYVLEDGTVKVADFGIARVESSSLTQAGVVLGTPAYMSPEQFMGQAIDGRSDLFSAAVILYQFLTGERPFAANQASTIMHKVLQEDPAPPSALNVQVPRAFDAVLRKALAKRPADRYQTGRELADAIRAAASGETVAPAAGDATVIDLMALAREAKDPGPAPPAAPPPEAAAPKRRSSASPWIAAGFVAIAALVVAGWLAFRPTPSTAPVAAPAAAPSTPAAASPAPANETVSVPAQSRRFDAVEALDRIFEARDRNHRVTVVPEQPRIRIGRDPLRFRVESARGGYLYVLMVGTDRTHFNLLFPNAVDADNRIAAGAEVRLPREGWSMTAGGPRGTNHFVAIVSERPRDFTAAGLRKVDPFGEFPMEAAAALLLRTGDATVFAGTASCAAGEACPGKYGAATFSIEEIDP